MTQSNHCSIMASNTSENSTSASFSSYPTMMPCTQPFNTATTTSLGVPALQRSYQPPGYRDFANVNEFTGRTSEATAADSYNPSATVAPLFGRSSDLIFPQKLHLLLTATERDPALATIVSWKVHGRAFAVHDRKRFMVEILPEWFLQSRFESFQRQLNLYGFKRITSGPDRGSCYHQLFLRQKTFLADRMQRVRLKGSGPRKPATPDLEPNFYRMSLLPSEEQIKPNEVDAPSEVAATSNNAGPYRPIAPKSSKHSTPFSHPAPLQDHSQICTNNNPASSLVERQPSTMGLATLMMRPLQLNTTFVANSWFGNQDAQPHHQIPTHDIADFPLYAYPDAATTSTSQASSYYNAVPLAAPPLLWNTAPDVTAIVLAVPGSTTQPTRGWEDAENVNGTTPVPRLVSQNTLVDASGKDETDPVSIAGGFLSSRMVNAFQDTDVDYALIMSELAQGGLQSFNS